MNVKKFVTSQRPLIILTIIYFVTRFINLTILPIFTDESIYLYWAKFIETYKMQWFLPLTDGKPPLFIWCISILLALFPDQYYLEAGRIISVLFGFASLVGIYKLSELLFSEKSPRVPVIAAVLYIITPYTFFYDRIALFDTPLTASLVWTIFFALTLVKTPTLQIALLLGCMLGSAFWLKSTALVYWLLLPFVVLLRFWTSDIKYQGERKKVAIALFIALCLSQVINQALRLSSAYPAFVAKNDQFSVGLDTLWPNPFVHTYVSFPALMKWSGEWMTWPLFIFGVAGILYVYLKDRSSGVTLAVLWFFPIMGFAIIGQQLFPRYVLVTTPYLLIGASLLLHDVLFHKNSRIRYVGIGASCICIIYIMPFLYALSTNPVNAPMPIPDYNQYVADHPSGYGLDTAFAIIDSTLKEAGEVTVITQGTFGLYPYAFTLRYWNSKNIHLVPVWPLYSFLDFPKNLPQDHPVLIIFKENYDHINIIPMTTVSIIPKPVSDKPPIVVTRYNPLISN